MKAEPTEQQRRTVKNTHDKSKIMAALHEAVEDLHGARINAGLRHCENLMRFA